MPSELTSIEVELPKDIIFAMHGNKRHRNKDDIKKKLKLSLAIILFQEEKISLGKAVELAGVSRMRFMQLLKAFNLPAYEYTEDDFDSDRQAIDQYLKSIEK